MDHIMNNRLSLEFGQPYARIPLYKSPHIVHGDALTRLRRIGPGCCRPTSVRNVLGNPPL